MTSTEDLVGPIVGYTELLDREIKKQIEKDSVEKTQKNRRFFPLRPSSAGYCSRRLGYELMEYRGLATYKKELLEPHVWKLLNLGHSVEYSVLKNMEHLGFHGFDIRYKQQTLTLFKLNPVRVNDKEYPGEIIEGSCDGVLFSEKYKCLFDVKSVKDAFSVAYRTKFEETMVKFSRMHSVKVLSPNAFYITDLEVFLNELDPDDFLKDNIFQLSVYGTTGFMRSRGIDHCVIWKYNKNDSKEYEIRFKPSIQIAGYVESKFNFINEKVWHGKVDEIPRDHNLGSVKCAFCPYRSECWQNDTKKAFYATLGDKDWPTDSEKLIEYQKLESDFKQFQSLANLEETKGHLEQAIIKELIRLKVKKIRLKDKSIWEIKELKTPRPHFELRRSKL